MKAANRKSPPLPKKGSNNPDKKRRRKTAPKVDWAAIHADYLAYHPLAQMNGRAP